jgi:molybdopterin-guanine dinucleotide biosynthesis protein A
VVIGNQQMSKSVNLFYNRSMFTLAVQAGGQSSRMGEDKALKPFLGRPLIQRVIERLALMADEVLVTTNRPEAFAFLNLPLFPDLKPGRALGGLYTALASSNCELWGWRPVTCPSPAGRFSSTCTHF